MKYNELILTKAKKPKRIGRGIAAGQGKTAGRGTKGQGSRKSGNLRPGFEGGQMPLYMRLPKLRGFKSHRVPAEIVYTGQLEALRAVNIDNHSLYGAKLVSSPHVRVKVLLKGDIKSKKTIRLQQASQAAVAAIEKTGGSFQETPQNGRTAKKSSKTEN